MKPNRSFARSVAPIAHPHSSTLGLMRLAAASAIAVSLTLIPLSGCSGAGGASDLVAKPKPTILRGEAPVHFPSNDGKLEIALSSFTKNPGLAGTVAGDAQASADGTGKANADVKNGGSATALVQLGHAFSNQSDRQVDLSIVVHFDFRYRLTAELKPGATDATLALNIFVRDEHGRVLRTLNLANHVTDQGSIERSGSEEHTLIVTLSPGQTVQVFLAGTLAIDTLKSDRSAAGEFSFDKFSIAATPHAAPPVGATDGAR